MSTKFIFETPEEKVKRLLYLETTKPTSIESIKKLSTPEQAFYIQYSGFTDTELLIFILKTYGLSNQEIITTLSSSYSTHIEIRNFSTMFKKIVDKMLKIIS